MGTIADKLENIENCKENIRVAIESKGVSCPDSTVFSAYPDKIIEIQNNGTGSGTDLSLISFQIHAEIDQVFQPAYSGTVNVTDDLLAIVPATARIAQLSYRAGEATLLALNPTES